MLYFANTSDLDFVRTTQWKYTRNYMYVSERLKMISWPSSTAQLDFKSQSLGDCAKKGEICQEGDTCQKWMFKN